ncbi:hypothetical protein SU69_02850 [Thermosipho melanesiensis]|uniref:Uncharacterized protein n=2 Tax=Thermosipho melanesiensis TaxID=46541 RepID=A6LKH2_THEM4|nr:hypothetical protein [Thermosipho melanesiensis]ABR30423.1 hypothetical protein Tmel_0556 [Thermosipho melanesiensis BI429]APT73583.1 hypothetical protein BW47_02975 [Thermosipho melanesiensis]OOC37531.1 hypothetical protein SU68_02870 [Thermosipho melanesiensis]OOC39427.1 hypothetical protein SU69_02850 [Thermosipho melanesiensis]OOC39490.1 hypothetical protein SU70_02850 [Thermosipho melanesiensis]
MIKLKVNGNLETFEASKYNNFGELLDDVSKRLKGMVLSEVKVNQKDVPINKIDELRTAILDEELEIEMNFVPLQEFFITTLTDVIKYIDNISNLLKEVSNNILLGENEGFNNIVDLAEGISAMENLRVNAMKMTGFTPSDFENKISGNKVAEILQIFVEALERKDLLELSDILFEKIPIVLEYYKSYFQNILTTLKQNN